MLQAKDIQLYNMLQAMEIQPHNMLQDKNSNKPCDKFKLRQDEVRQLRAELRNMEESRDSTFTDMILAYPYPVRTDSDDVADSSSPITGRQNET